MAKLNVEVLDMVNGKITKVAYEGAEYAKVEGKAEVGDLVLNVSETAFFTLGAFYLAFDTYSTGEPRMKDDDNDNLGMGEGNYALFRKISADKPTLEQRVGALENDVATIKGEKKSTNTFKIGDTIKVVRNTASWGKKEKAGYHVGGQGVVKVGAIGEVTAVSGDFVTTKFAYGDVNGDSQRKKELRFDEIELAEETIEFEGATYRKVEREAREGDVVIFRKNTSFCASNNKPYLVTEVIEGAPKFYDGSRFSVYFGTYGRTRETVDVYEAKYVPQEGDIVVVTGNTSGSCNAVGDIGKLSDVSSYDAMVNVPDKPGGRKLNGNWHKFGDFRKATPAEVEKYEQAVKDAEIASKWTKIGRKPNEFKKGDVVRVLGVCSGHEIAGQLGEIVIADGSDQPRVRAVYEDELIELWTRVELVAPVESIFNA